MERTSSGRDSCKRVDEAERPEEVGFWQNPENICRLLDLLFLGREDEPTGLPS